MTVLTAHDWLVTGLLSLMALVAIPGGIASWRGRTVGAYAIVGFEVLVLLALLAFA